MSIITERLTTNEISQLVGMRLRQRRLAQNYLIDDLAFHAGVNRKTVIALESGEDVRFSSVTKVLRSLGMLSLLETAIPDELPNGDALTKQAQPRQRAVAKRSKGRRG